MKNIHNQLIIDSHHHLWDPTTGNYDWLVAQGHEVFNKKYLIDDYLGDVGKLNVIKTVHLQAEINRSETVYETDWLQEYSQSGSSLNINKFPNAIIGYVNFIDLNVEEILENHLKNSNFRGVRQLLNYDKNNKSISHVDLDYLEESAWLKNFFLLKKNNLSFDLSILYNQSENAAKLINSNQDTLFIINHSLTPIEIDNESIKDWLKGIKLLSSFDNVVIKLSGFGEFNTNWTEESMRPLILNSIDHFGIDRCMFGTNFPVDKFLSNASYFDYWNTYFTIVNSFNDAEKDNLFYKNAEKYYKI
jgi:predicted TIM-barrel fold metal-dependent hydrolase